MSLSLQQKQNITNTLHVLILSLKSKVNIDDMIQLTENIIKSVNRSLVVPAWGQQIKDYLLALLNFYIPESEEIRMLVGNIFIEFKKCGLQITDSQKKLDADRIKKAPMRIQALVDMDGVQPEFTVMENIYKEIKDNEVENNIIRFVTNIYIQKAGKNQIDLYSIFMDNYHQISSFLKFTQQLSVLDANNLIFNHLKTFEDYNIVLKNASKLNEAITIIQFLLREDKHFLTVISMMNINEKIEFIETLNTLAVQQLLIKKRLSVANICEFDKNNELGFFTNRSFHVKWNHQQIIGLANYLIESPIVTYIDLGYLEIRPNENVQSIQQRFELLQKEYNFIQTLISSKKITKEGIRNLNFNSEVELTKILVFLSTITSSATVINFILKNTNILNQIIKVSEKEKKVLLSAMQCVEIRKVLVAQHPISLNDILLVWNDIPKRMNLLAALENQTIYNEMQRDGSDFNQHKHKFKSGLKLNKILEIGKLVSHVRIYQLLNVGILNSKDLLNNRDWNAETFITKAQYKALLLLKEKVQQKYVNKLIKPQGMKQLSAHLERLDDLQINLYSEKSISQVAITVTDIFTQVSNYLDKNKLVKSIWKDEFAEFCADESKKLNPFTEFTSAHVDYYSAGSQYAIFESKPAILQKAFDCFVKVPDTHPLYVNSLWECVRIKFKFNQVHDAHYFCKLTLEAAKEKHNLIMQYNAQSWLQKLEDGIDGNAIPRTMHDAEFKNAEIPYYESPRLQ